MEGHDNKPEARPDLNSKAYEIIRNLESRLRECIRIELSALTANWWKERISQDVRMNAEERASKVISKTEGSQLLEYVDFPDHEKIILTANNWRDAFSKIFLVKDFVSLRFSELEPIRNDVMHGRSLSEEEFHSVLIFGRQLTDRIPDYTSRKMKIKANLVSIAKRLGYGSELDSVHGQYSYDVVWIEKNPSIPLAVFEVQDTEKVADSLIKLRYAYDQWKSRICFISTLTNLEKAKFLLRGTFLDLADKVSPISFEIAGDLPLLQHKLASSETV